MATEFSALFESAQTLPTAPFDTKWRGSIDSTNHVLTFGAVNQSECRELVPPAVREARVIREYHLSGSVRRSQTSTERPRAPAGGKTVCGKRVDVMVRRQFVRSSSLFGIWKVDQVGVSVRHHHRSTWVKTRTAAQLTPLYMYFKWLQLVVLHVLHS